MFSSYSVILVASFLLYVKAENGTSDFLSKYNTYNTVCRGMGYMYQDQNCKGKGVIAFYAETSTVQQNLPRKAVVFFKNIILNSGGAYDATTGKFTAPNNGIYFFSWTIATAAGNWFSTEIVLNDKIFGRNHVNGKSSSPNYESGSATAIIKVERDDKVWIRVYDEKGYAYAEWSSFSGFQL